MSVSNNNPKKQRHNFRTMSEWKTLHKIAQHQKIFALAPRPRTNSTNQKENEENFEPREPTGPLDAIRIHLISKGWVENTEAKSSFWDFKYSLSRKDLGIRPSMLACKQSCERLLPQDVCLNFFGSTGGLTTKNGLLRNLDRYVQDHFYGSTTTTKGQNHMMNNTQSGGAAAGGTSSGTSSTFVGGIAMGIAMSFDLSDMRSTVQFVEHYQRQHCRSLLYKYSRGLCNPDQELQLKISWNCVKSRSNKSPQLSKEFWKAVSSTKTQQHNINHNNINNLHHGHGREHGREGGRDHGRDSTNSHTTNSHTSSSTSSTSEEVLLEECTGRNVHHTIQNDFMPELGSQLKDFSFNGLDGPENLWILKPTNANRGRGIRVVKDLNDILKYARCPPLGCLGNQNSLIAAHSNAQDNLFSRHTKSILRGTSSTKGLLISPPPTTMDWLNLLSPKNHNPTNSPIVVNGGGLNGHPDFASEKYMIQKYIERPLLINKKKFDIRQWVLVTEFEPELRAWFYQDSYLRFASHNYTVSSIGGSFDSFCHLTNNAVIKNTSDVKDFNIDNTMWTNKQFEEYLKNEYNSTKLLNWNSIQTQMKRLVWISLQACRDKVVERKNSFELFGYDFMVDSTGIVWIIECNSSPDLSFSTKVTRQLVTEMMPQLCDVILTEEEMSTSNPFTRNNKVCGKFQKLDSHDIQQSCQAIGINNPGYLGTAYNNKVSTSSNNLWNSGGLTGHNNLIINSLSPLNGSINGGNVVDNNSPVSAHGIISHGVGHPPIRVYSGTGSVSSQGGAGSYSPSSKSKMKNKKRNNSFGCNNNSADEYGYNNYRFGYYHADRQHDINIKKEAPGGGEDRIINHAREKNILSQMIEKLESGTDNSNGTSNVTRETTKIIGGNDKETSKNSLESDLTVVGKTSFLAAVSQRQDQAIKAYKKAYNRNGWFGPPGSGPGSTSGGVTGTNFTGSPGYGTTTRIMGTTQHNNSYHGSNAVSVSPVSNRRTNYKQEKLMISTHGGRSQSVDATSLLAKAKYVAVQKGAKSKKGFTSLSFLSGIGKS